MTNDRVDHEKKTYKTYINIIWNLFLKKNV